MAARLCNIVDSRALMQVCVGVTVVLIVCVAGDDNLMHHTELNYQFNFSC
jgi:hypothetical protein